jgi:hypothetical protein
MGLVEFVILIIVVVAVIAIGAWFVRSSGITIPQPLMIAFYAIAAILAILIVVRAAGLWGGPAVVVP